MQTPESSIPRTPRNPQKQKSVRLARLALIAAGVAVAIIVAWQSTAIIWGSFGDGNRVIPIWDLDYQASHRAWDVDTQVNASRQS